MTLILEKHVLLVGFRHESAPGGGRMWDYGTGGDRPHFKYFQQISNDK